jgi:hypothetical protein
MCVEDLKSKNWSWRGCHDLIPFFAREGDYEILRGKERSSLLISFIIYSPQILLTGIVMVCIDFFSHTL